MVLDINTELDKALALHTQAQADVNTALGRLHTAGIHLTNIQALLRKKQLPELGAFIVDNGSYGSALTARLKRYIDVLAASKFRHVILFQNKWQIVNDKFPKYITGRGMTFTLDTMYSVRRDTTDAEFAAYMAMAEQLNPRDYRFDDAHNQTPEQLAAAVKFMRNYTDSPVYGSFGAEDFKTVDGKRVAFDMQAYADAGLLIMRQFFRQGEPVSVVDGWLKSGRITHGVDLEAFKAGSVTTSPQDFADMLAKCLNAGMDMLTCYAPVNGRGWLMWQKSPELWQAVQSGAETVRLWQQ